MRYQVKVEFCPTPTFSRAAVKADFADEANASFYFLSCVVNGFDGRDKTGHATSVELDTVDGDVAETICSMRFNCRHPKGS